MEALSNLIKETIPNYLRGLPVPNDFAGIFKLSATEWLQLTPLIALITLPTYYLTKTYRRISSAERPQSKVNLNVQKEVSKVVDTVDIEEIKQCDAKKKVYCRCWRSKQFPLCDGSHNLHNDVTGDNVGPLIVKS